MKYLAIAHASSFELETQLIISMNLGYISADKLHGLTKLITELQKMNFAIQSKLQERLMSNY